MESCKTLCRILALPIFPNVPQSGFNNSGERISFLFFLHVISGLFVINGVFAAEQATSEESNIKNWVVVTVFVTIGLISLVILLIAGCRNTLHTNRIPETKMSDPSLNLRIGFLWVFGLVVMIHVSLNFATYIDCIQSYSLRGVHVTFLLTSNIILLLFLIIQITFVSYFQHTCTSFTRGYIINFASMFVLVANFVIWYSVVVSKSTSLGMMKNDAESNQSNETYCFLTSKIQQKLSLNMTPYLFPSRMEFCILASSFIITLRRWPMDYVRNEGSYTDYQVLHENIDDRNVPSPEKRNHINGPHIFATVCGFVINMPTFFSAILLVFVSDWNQEALLLTIYTGESLSAVCSIAIVYICSYCLNKNFSNSWRHSKLTTNEYILILTSSGMVTYFTIGILTNFSYPQNMKMYACCRFLGLLEIFLQTYFFIRIRRYNLNGNHSILISSCGIILMLTNLIYWLLNSYKQNAFAESREIFLVEREKWLYIENILVPLLTFYRFFSAMSAYSLYCKFKPNR
ncbi:uncharacterized protein LOC125675125 [Ostrea edulis]|uniref:uncharacterized protein LOC125675125 n=1 Tax=Ostrea edulis TaxID=37623 RepID=UPI002095C5E6|nr:uncharacterized protein LOC125675125 [Ostrea edulis]